MSETLVEKGRSLAKWSVSYAGRDSEKREIEARIDRMTEKRKRNRPKMVVHDFIEEKRK